MRETDVRLEMIDSILKTPHGNFTSLPELHKKCMTADLLFYLKLAMYYQEVGKVRDHNKVFAAAIATSGAYEFRKLGGYLMFGLNPKDFLTTAKMAMSDFGGSTGGKRRGLRKYSEIFVRDMEKQADIGRGANRFLENSKFLRKLFTIFRIAPSLRTAVSLHLYKAGNKPDATAYLPFLAIKKLSKTEDEQTICEIIDANKLPPLTTLGALKIKLTPAIAASLVKGMSPKQLQNFTGMLQKKGLLEDPDFKKAVTAKLKKGGKNLSMRGTVAAKKLGKDADIMKDATDSFVKSLPMIRGKKILLCIDKSKSMEKAIILGKDAASTLASKVENPEENLLILAFGATAGIVPLPVKKTFSEFEITFRYMTADGSTSIGVCIEKALEMGFTPDTVVFITDGRENTPPFFETVLSNSDLKLTRFVTCLVGDIIEDVKISNTLIKSRGFEVENVDFSKGDYYSLPNVIELISKGGVRELIKHIDSIDLFGKLAEYRDRFSKRGITL